MLSFNIVDFLGVLENYNLAIWPLQIIAFVLGLIAVYLAIKRTKYSDKIILAILSFFWLWNGIIFCPIYWAPTYPSAYLFGALCTLQGLLFVYGIFKSDIVFEYRSNNNTLIGILFIVYAIAGYQLFGYFIGHVYPKLFPVGLVPCPTTIFTFGLFLLTTKRIPKLYFVIPLIIGLGGFLAVSKGVYEDIGLIIAAILGILLIILRDRKIELKT
jgi:hypothetical protein